MKKPKQIIGLVFALTLIITVGFLWLNRNSNAMTVRQKLLQTVYPALMYFTRIGGVNASILTHQAMIPSVSFDSLRATLTHGEPFDWSTLRGKKVLIVNTASDCGYTAQYAELQQLAERYAGKLVVLGFPSNEFKEQEKGTNHSIQQFCQLHYGVKFPLMQKANVLPGPQQHEVYQWLTQSSKNAWNNQGPVWNFSKYLVDEQGRLILVAGPSVSPTDTRLLPFIEN